MQRKVFLNAVLALSILLLFTSGTAAQTAKLNVGYSAISGDQLPAWIAKETGIGNVERDILEKTREGLLTDAILPKKQYPTIEGIKTVLAPLAAKDPKAKAAQPEQFADMNFIIELDKNGYIDGLYKKQ